MPVRDQTRNIETFRSEGKEINEFEFQKNQAKIAEQSHPAVPETPTQLHPESRAEQIANLTAAAREKVEKRSRRRAGKKAAKYGVASSSTRSASKRAAKKAANRGTRKSAKRATAKATKRGAKKKPSAKSRSGRQKS